MEISEGRIVLDKELNKLDRFVLDFTAILEPITPYVLVSGYVSILFGRSRISEDIDLLVPRLSREQFERLHHALLAHFWCLNADSLDELFDLLCTKHSIRYARPETVIPNMELKQCMTVVDEAAFTRRVEVVMGDWRLYVSPIELQIVFKELVLKSPKDLEDALHLREVFAQRLSQRRLSEYAEMVRHA
jgi:hypothetical protein